MPVGLMTLILLENTKLRRAIRSNRVTFPSQIPRLLKLPAGDLQQRIVQLFFVRGWSARDISGRSGLSKARVLRILADWKIRAIDSGWIQEIEPDFEGAQDAGAGASVDSENAVQIMPISFEQSDSTPSPLRVMERPVSRPQTTPTEYNGTSELLPTTLWPSRSKYSVDGENSAAS